MKKKGNNQLALALTFEDIIKMLPGHVYWKDCNGVFLGCNDQQAKFFGLKSAQDLKGKTDYDVVPKKIADKIVKNDRKVIETGVEATVEEISTLPDGGIGVYLSKKTPLKDTAGKVVGILGISFNITAEKREQSRQQNILDSIISKLPGHVYWKDREGRFLGCNTQQAKTAGFNSPSDMIGKTDADMPWKEQAEYLREIDQGVMRSGKEQTIYEDFLLPDGTKKLFLSKKMPLTDDDGKVFGVLGISFDVTKEKQLEKELQESKESEARFKALSALSGMIAHELRTPLATIEGSMEIIEKVLPTLIESYEYAVMTDKVKQPLRKDLLDAFKQTLGDVKHSCNYAQATIDSVLAGIHHTTTPTAPQIENFSIRQVVQQAIDSYPFRESEKTLIIIKHLDDIAVTSQRAIITHVLHNLFKNALHAIQAAGKGQITIWTKQQNKYLRLYVEDTAKGIPSKQLPHIFDAFYTTKKSTAQSLGIGLYFCKTALEKIGAHITCESELERYTRFIIRLPLTKQNNH